jgi:hypothetical protein
MIAEYDVVELLADLPDARMEYDTDAPLHAGDSGTVVAAYPDDGAYTVALATVTAAQVRLVWRAAGNGEE